MIFEGYPPIQEGTWSSLTTRLLKCINEKYTFRCEEFYRKMDDSTGILIKMRDYPFSRSDETPLYENNNDKYYMDNGNLSAEHAMKIIKEVDKFFDLNASIKLK